MNIDQHRHTEANTLTAAAALVCALGCASALIPGVEHVVNLGLLVLAVLGALGLAVRLAARWLRERAEDRADALTAAAWRAEHATGSHLARPRPLAGTAIGRVA